MSYYEARHVLIHTTCGYTPPGALRCSRQATHWITVNEDEPEGVFLCDFHIGYLAGEAIQDDGQENGVRL